MRNRSKIGIMKAVAIFIAMEILVFLLAAVFYFVIGVSDSGIQGGFQMASGVLYSWFGFVMLGFIGWLVIMIVLAFKGKNRPLEQPK
jgi:hypothetical protein